MLRPFFCYVDDLVSRETSSGRLYVLQDANWNVVALCDIDGEVLERYTYDGFGKRNVYAPNGSARSTSAYGFDRAFTGQVLDEVTGLTLYRNRYYHAGLGRFVTRDPIGYRSGDTNLYRYVWNQPSYNIDSLGEQAQRFAPGYGRPRDFRGNYVRYHDDYHDPIPPPPFPKPKNRIPTPEGDPCIPPPDASECWEPPQTKEREFYYACRLMNNPNGDKSVDAGNSIGASHCYIQMGQVDENGNPVRNSNGIGTTGIGTGGGQHSAKGNYANNPERGFNPTTQRSLEINNGKMLEYGSAKNKKAEDATDCEIWDCIKNHPQQKTYCSDPGARFYVCWSWAKEAYKACGLK